MFLRFIQNNKIYQSAIFFFFLVLPLQFGKHFWPSFSFLFGIRIDYLSPTVYISDLSSLLIIFLAIINRRKFFHLPAFLFLFILFLSTGIVFSKNPLFGWYLLGKFVEMIFVGYSLVWFLSKEDLKKCMFPAILSVVIFESILAIWQFLTQKSIGGPFYFLGERTFSATTPGIANASIHGQLLLRPYATFSHPNVLAGFLVIALTILSMKFFGRGLKEKFAYSLGLIIGTIALVSTLSRVAIFLWCLYLIVFLIASIKNKYLRMLSLSVPIIFFFLIPDIQARFLNLSFSSQAVQQRIQLMQSALDMFFSSPFFGVGFGNFLNELATKKVLLTSPVIVLQPVHNVFLLTLAETGAIGLMVFLLFLGRILRYLIILYKNANRKKKRNFLIPFFLFFEVLLLGMFDHYFLTIQQGQLLLVFIFSLLLSTKSRSIKHDTI